jgi:virulence factor
MSTPKLRVGLIGAGAIAQVAQLPALAEAPGVEIAGIVTRRPESAAANLRRWPVGRAYPDAEAMVDDARLDALFVLTPRHEHVTGVELALSAEIPVFCEKPLATTATEARRVAELADERQLVLQVGFNRRYAPAYREAREAFADGEVQFCVAEKHRRGSEYRATLENAIHMIDLLRWFCGEPEPGGVVAHAIAPDPYEEDGLAALVRFEGGAVGTLVAARRAGEWDERLEAFGGDKSARVVAPETAAITVAGTTTLSEARPRAYGWTSATETLGFRAATLDFLRCARERTRPLVDGLEAAKTQALLETILQQAGLPLSEHADREWVSHGAAR